MKLSPEEKRIWENAFTTRRSERLSTEHSINYANDIVLELRGYFKTEQFRHDDMEVNGGDRVEYERLKKKFEK